MIYRYFNEIIIIMAISMALFVMFLETSVNETRRGILRSKKKTLRLKRKVGA